MRCLENPQEWLAHYANPTRTIDKKARQNLTQWTPKVTAPWQELETVLASADFQAQSMRKFSYTGTDYEACTQALTYAIAFQKDYARADGLSRSRVSRVQQAAAGLQKYLQHLPPQ